MNAYEQAKKNIARAEELAQAVKDGKIVQPLEDKRASSSGNKSAYEFYEAICAGWSYRILEPKRRRPWTREEAELHIGWVLVDPKGRRASLDYANENTVWWPHHTNVNFDALCKDGWRVYRTDKPEDLKPCWVEE